MYTHFILMTQEFIQPPFVYRGYTKQELAQLYAPSLAPRTAIRRLNEWIKQNPKLRRELERTGVTISTQVFRRSQVSIIVEYLGEP